MHKTIEKTERLCKMMNRLSELMETQLSGDLHYVDRQEAGEVIDMIKDLSEAEKNCWKACYYREKVEALEDGDDGLVLDGHITEGHMPEWTHKWNLRRGYMPGKTDHVMMDDAHYGKSYEEYQEAKHRYAATNSQEDREMMERNADKHVYNSITTVREIYKAADPEMKKRIKADLIKLVGEMPT